MKSINEDIESFKEFYDNINHLYSTIYPNYIEHNKILAKSLLREIDFKNLRYVVDIGCGASNLLDELAKSNPNIQFVGIDFSPKTIEYCNNQFQRSNLTYMLNEWTKGLTKIVSSNGDQSIDLITCFGNTFCHYSKEEQARIVSMIKELLSKDGVFLFDSYKNWNSKLGDSVDFVFEPKNIVKSSDGTIVTSSFFSKYQKDIAIRNIFLTSYNEFFDPPIKSSHYVTWQYPLRDEFSTLVVELEDDLKLFQYYKILNV